MRVLILSDVHANAAALEAVLDAAGEIDAVLNLGDLVGYGPDPNEVVKRVRDLPLAASLLGNHDLAALRRLDLATFNPWARAAAEWTARQLTAEMRDYLEHLEPHAQALGFHLAHASPRDPVWEYMVHASQGPANFAAFAEPVAFVGHTHVPRIFTRQARTEVSPARENTILRLEMEPRRILNPGSVGQPRDGDPQAAYATLDTDTGTLIFRRVPYDIARTQARMAAAGLPRPLADRLSYGR